MRDLNKSAQITWAVAGFYTGGIDGDIGPKSNKAMSQIMGYLPPQVRRWSQKRQIVATMQWCLNKLGYQAGTIDGYAGNNTNEAMRSLLYKLATGKQEVIERTPVKQGVVIPSSDIPSQKEVREYYGDPETEVPGRLVQIIVPFEMRIDWNLSQRTSKITVHRLAAPSLLRALTEVHDEYGIDEMRRLGLDRTAGTYNKRKMRGGSSWSMHAYGCAKDFFAAPNGLRMRCPDALFCGPEYKKFLDIMEANEWLPAIRLWGADAMHFQRCYI